MRFYEFTYRLRIVDRITSEVTISGPIREWFGSERDAVVRRLELYKAAALPGRKKDHEIWPVDIPTDKKGLLRWLQENVKSNR